MQKMGTSLCDVTMTIKQQEKMQTFFFLNRIHFSTRKCMFDTFTQKCTWDYTAPYTKEAITQIGILASCLRWPSLRSIPSAMGRAPAIGPRSGPVPHVHKWSAG